MSIYCTEPSTTGAREMYLNDYGAPGCVYFGVIVKYNINRLHTEKQMFIFASVQISMNVHVCVYCVCAPMGTDDSNNITSVGCK